MQATRRSKSEAVIVDTVIGIPILFVAFTLLVGGIEEALFFLLLAVVCTLGVSLVILLPLAWVMGMLARTVVTALMRQVQGARSAA